MLNRLVVRSSLLAALVVSCGVVRPPMAHAATVWTVSALAASDPATCDSTQSFKTIQAAITCAASTGDSTNTINVAAGDYYESLVITAPVPNYVLILQGAGDGADPTSASTLHSVLGTTITTGAAGSTYQPSVVISGMRVTDGFRCKFCNYSGGGIDNYGTLTVDHSTVTNNGDYDGAGINNLGSLTVTNSTISNNYSVGGFTPLPGSGIWNQGTATIKSSDISNNTTGIDNSGQLAVSDSQISNNANYVVGAGITNSGTAALSNTVIAHNSAVAGGGIYNSGVLVAGNTTVNSNTASFVGGGIDNAGTLSLTRASAVSVNTASSTSPAGGGIYNQGVLYLHGFNQKGGRIGKNAPDDCVNIDPGTGC